MNTILFVVSAPSGAGKSSLLQALLATDDRLSLSVSHTTRPARPNEQPGVHYHFIDAATFEQLDQQGHFIESANVFGQYYGTSKTALQHQLNTSDVALEIDWQGARAIRACFPHAITIFIAPPSIETLHQRLQQRGQDNPQIIQQRMQQAQSELSHYHEYDYLLINETFTTTLHDLQHILAAERLRLTQNTTHPVNQQVRRMLPA
jgi:guanylate kinase